MSPGKREEQGSLSAITKRTTFPTNELGIADDDHHVGGRARSLLLAARLLRIRVGRGRCRVRDLMSAHSRAAVDRAGRAGVLRTAGSRYSGFHLGRATTWPGSIVTTFELAMIALTGGSHTSAVREHSRRPGSPSSGASLRTHAALAASAQAFCASARWLQLGPGVAVIAFNAVAANLAAIMGGILMFPDPLGSARWPPPDGSSRSPSYRRRGLHAPHLVGERAGHPGLLRRLSGHPAGPAGGARRPLPAFVDRACYADAGTICNGAHSANASTNRLR